VEIKCQLDATEVCIADLIACSTRFGHHYAHHQELKNIIQWLLSVVFGAVVFKLLVWCGAEDYVSGLQDPLELLMMGIGAVVFQLLFWCGAEGCVSGLQDPLELLMMGIGDVVQVVGLVWSWRLCVRFAGFS